MIKQFFDLVELRTKITSVFSFGLALSYLYLNQVRIQWDRTVIFFVAMVAIDMMATALNNVRGARSENENLPVSSRTAWLSIALLALLGIGLGLYLSRIAGMVVLACGVLCFFFGVLYSYGPVPISYTPFGEVTSGIFYGLVIPFLTLQINYPSGTMLEIRYLGMSLAANFQILPIMRLLILSAIPVILTANVMLANNLCDLEKDRSIGRHTLPSYLGKERALKLWRLGYYMVFVMAIVAVVSGTIPWPYALILLALSKVRKEMDRFCSGPSKSKTFPAAIRLYIGLMSVAILLVTLCGLVERWLV